MDDEVDELTVVHQSMSIEDAKNRLIDPENIVMGGKTSASMYEFVPSKESLGMEDWVEEKDYFTKYGENKKTIPFDIVPEKCYEFPKKLDAFIHPYGNFDHFSAPRRPNGEILLLFFTRLNMQRGFWKKKIKTLAGLLKS